MRTRTGRALATAALIPLAALSLLAGCGDDSGEATAGDGEATSIDLALDFYVNPDHAGIYQGLADGSFSEAGLEVEALVPSDPSAPIKQVATGDVDLAISYEPEVMLAREQGLPVVAVAALVDEPLTSLISLPEAGIESPADLAGKRLVTAGIPYQAAFLEAILEREGLTPGDVEQIDVGLGLLPAVLGGRADAMLGGFRNIEGVDLAERGKDPRVVPVDEIGIPTYDELVLVANTERIAEDPEPIRDFIAALGAATANAAADPASATEAVLEAGDGLDPDLTAAEIEATLPLLEARGGEPFGQMDPGEWQAFAEFMAEQGLISQVPPIEELMTNELIGK